MADSNVAITAGSGTLIDTQVPTGGDHRQVVVLGDPATVANVANVSSTGSVQVAGAAASGSALVGNPVLAAGSDGTNARSLATDTSGRLITVPPDTSAAISIALNATSSGQITGLTGSGVAMVQLTGTWTATVQVQLTVDGTNWLNITGSNSIVNTATTAYMASGNLTAVGAYMVDVTGATGVRVITTAYTSGTITGTVRVVPGAGGSTAIAGIPLVAQSGTWTVGVTGYPTAAASADAFANPTVTQVGAANLVYNGATWDRARTATADAQVVTGITAAGNMRYNGATWDRARSNWNTTTGDTGAKTASFTGATVTNYDARGAYITVLCGTVSGTTPTLVAQLQWSPDAGTTWVNIGPATTAITTTGNTATIAVYPANLSQTAGGTPANLTTGATATTAINAPLPRTWRLNYVITGTTPSFTITAVYVNYIT
jgi:hypothetical protein